MEKARAVVCSAAGVRIDDSIEKARQLRDELVSGNIVSKQGAARHIHKIYPEANNEALPDAMENLLGACSGDDQAGALLCIRVYILCTLTASLPRSAFTPLTR